MEAFRPKPGARRSSDQTNAWLLFMAVKVRVATDCSGTDVPLYAIAETEAYKQKKIRVVHQWSSDTDPTARAFIEANHEPKYMFSDVSCRDNSQLPTCDLYFAGFPCQPFSMQGLRLGLRDTRTGAYRGVLATIREGRIRAFLLENVTGLLHDNGGKTFQKILDELESCGLLVGWRVYKTSDFGIPQARPRIYILGVRKELGITPKLPRPPAISPAPLSTFLDADKGPRDAWPSSSMTSHVSRNLRRALRMIKRRGSNPKRDTWAVDVDWYCFRNSGYPIRRIYEPFVRVYVLAKPILKTLTWD